MLKKISSSVAPKQVINALITLFHQGKIEDILSRAPKILEEYPNTPILYNILGTISVEKGQKLKAANYFRKTIELLPEDPDAYNNLGTVLNDLQENQEALISIKKAIALKPDYAEAYNNLGVTFLNNGDYGKAKLVFKKTIKIKPNYINPYLNLAFIYSNTNDLKKAISIINDYLKYDNEKEDILIQKANIFADFGYFNKAFKILKNLQRSYPKDVNIMSNMLTLSKYNKLNPNKIFKNYNIIKTQNNPSKINKRKSVIALIGFGRSGSLFLHSLFDGHPKISTLPGYFFSGWFGDKVWKELKPNFNSKNWRKELSENIINNFEPQFNSNSKKNVYGKPCGENYWLAKSTGFTELGEENNEVIALDTNKFSQNFVKILSNYENISSNECFEIIHKAFDISFRKELDKDRKIFFHFHNPVSIEHMNFIHNFPDSKILYLIRDPIQMMESWILGYKEKLRYVKRRWDKYRFYNNIYDRVIFPFRFIFDPRHCLLRSSTRGIKLEDIKRNPNNIIPIIADWIGINNHKSLYKSEFLNKKFSRPSYCFNNITGFDTRSIDVYKGRFFGKNDILILETLLWPFLRSYGYSTILEREFYENLRKIKPMLFEPFEFEISISKYLGLETAQIKGTDQFERFRRFIIPVYESLNNSNKYPEIIKPLI